jgi:Kef-type K+ transport system membrane component KefB
MQEKRLQQKLAAFILIYAAIILADTAGISIIYYLEQNGGINTKIANPSISTYIFGAALILAAIIVLIAPFVFKRLINKSNKSGCFSQYLSYWIMFMALTNVIAILGFLVYRTGGDTQKAYICITLSAFVLVLNFPKKTHLEKLQEKDAKF